MDRIRGCDILIETLALAGSGAWGNTALEAAALGKVVVTNTDHKDVYEKEYGPLPIHVANNAGELEVVLRELINLGKDGVLAEGRKTRDWVVKYHSMKATARKLWNRVYKQFFEVDNG